MIKLGLTWSRTPGRVADHMGSCKRWPGRPPCGPSLRVRRGPGMPTPSRSRRVCRLRCSRSRVHRIGVRSGPGRGRPQPPAFSAHLPCRLRTPPHRLDTVGRRMVMPTSLGLRSCGEALRGDLPPDTRTRLAEHLPIADEWDGVRDFWEALDLPRLSSVITLRASHQGARPDDTAAGVLQERASSFLRCLKELDRRPQSRDHHQMAAQRPGGENPDNHCHGQRRRTNHHRLANGRLSRGLGLEEFSRARQVTRWWVQAAGLSIAVMAVSTSVRARPRSVDGVGAAAAARAGLRRRSWARRRTTAAWKPKSVTW
jgi:hypothetical protein